MQAIKILKRLTVAIPLLTLAACSSTSETGTSTNGGTTTPPASESTNQNGTDTAVVTPIENNNVLTEQEIRNNELRKDHTIYFNFNAFTVMPKYDAVLDAHADYLRKNPSVKIVVEGFTDERGTPEYNIALGERRANAVSKYLQAVGVPASQIAIVSFGEEKPAVLGHTAADYAKNRRAIIVY